MSRMEKKCLLASTVMHGSLVLLLVFGSAFLTSSPKKQEFPRLRVVPHTLVDDALAGGGGNPNIPITDDVQKGDTMTPQPPAATPAPTPPTPQPTPVQPPPPAPTPKPIKPVVKQADPKPAPTKPEPVKIAKPLKPDLKAAEKTPDLKDLLKPIVRTGDDKVKAKAEAEAREAAREAAAAARAEAAYQAKLAKAFGGATSTLREGFASGTKVDVGGPGGQAYADYRMFVQAVYQETWERLLPQDILADDTTSLISVTISRSGRIINSRVVTRSRDTAIDRIVQRTLKEVTTIGRPFPSAAKDEERTFEIMFTFRKRRIAG
jgi:outer membrane biosynthesis protein TonB